MSNRQRFTAEAIPHYPELEEAMKSSGIQLSEIVFFELGMTEEIENVNWLEKTASAKISATLFVILKNGSEQKIGQINGPIHYV